MKHLSRWRTATASGAAAALAIGAFGVAGDPTDAAPIALTTEDGGAETTTVQLAADHSPDSPDSANSATSPDSAASTNSPTSTNSPASVDSPTSEDSADDAFPGRFSDVDPGNVHRSNIDELAARGITRGVTENTFAPRGTVTRAQFASFLARALGLDPVTGRRFVDVDPGSAHATAINAVADAGITDGVTDSTFEPNGRLTRAQLASLLAQALGLPASAGDGFIDVPPSSTHATTINAVAEKNITAGVTENTFEPNRTLRRDQMASLMIRALDRR